MGSYENKERGKRAKHGPGQKTVDLVLTGKKTGTLRCLFCRLLTTPVTPPFSFSWNLLDRLLGLRPDP